MGDPFGSYPLATRQQGALSERNPVCALAFRVCRKMCLEYGNIQFNLIKSIETADELFNYLVNHANNPPSVKWCYYWLEKQLMDSPPAIMCACATVSVSIAVMDNVPVQLRSLGIDLRCLIYGDASCIYESIYDAVHRQSISIAAADYELLPTSPIEEQHDLSSQELLTTIEDMNQQNNNGTVINGPVVYYGPVYQGCTIKMEKPFSAEDTPPASSTTSEHSQLLPADKAILAVHEAGICESSDWAAVLRLFKEREMMQPNGQPFDALYINRVCGKPVTSQSSISRSIMTTKVGGKYPYWRIKQDEETRQTTNKLRLYNEIGRIITEALS